MLRIIQRNIFYKYKPNIGTQAHNNIIVHLYPYNVYYYENANKAKSMFFLLIIIFSNGFLRAAVNHVTI